MKLKPGKGVRAWAIYVGGELLDLRTSRLAVFTRRWNFPDGKWVRVEIHPTKPKGRRGT